MLIHALARIPFVLMIMEIMSTSIIPAKCLLMLATSQLEVLSKI